MRIWMFYAEEETVSCITFNLGYLPGGDHSVATRADSSIRAVESGLKLLKKGGLMTLLYLQWRGYGISGTG